ncbi:MAG: Tail Collar protein [Gemmatimonadetes bacterium]|nr:Tail Collar protein [Gemmatimonadota bacterium]
MSDQFIGEIRMFALTFAPQGWANCDGAVLVISQNTALFSLLGTTYGGDGRTTYALPDLRGRAALAADNNNFFLGQQDGVETVALLQTEMPVHFHNALASSNTANVNSPSPSRMLARSRGGNAYQGVVNLTQMAPETLAPTGGSTPHNNMMPYLAVRFCIAVGGIFPPR